ncbi:MAG: 30S ribosome-binding factor RbfA [Planctomycetota bacterium]|jgi:ribosome-binding factor A|nr:30S ribosome-binding factor RbfA [Planctomycetota bacterium]
MPTRRQERVGKRIIQELVDAFRNLKHVDLGFLTVTGCEVSPDFRYARVGVSVYGEDGDKRRVMEELARNASRLRRMIGRPLGLKVIPELSFELDSSLETADRISRLIREARLTDANPNSLPPEAMEIAAPAPAEIEPFEAVREAIEAELLDSDAEGLDDDPAWRPINLDALPDGEAE